MPVALAPEILEDARNWARAGFLLLPRLLGVRLLSPLPIVAFFFLFFS
jgi:hypothetical protein